MIFIFQQYSICIRQEQGFCSITYSAIEDNELESIGWALDKTRLHLIYLLNFCLPGFLTLTL